MSEKRESSRSEIARQRRAERARNEMQQTGRRAAKPVLPVTSRVTQSYVVTKPRRAAQKKRRFNSAVGVPDVLLFRDGLRMPHVQPSWRLTSSLIALSLAVLIFLVLTLPFFHVTAATVIGNDRLSGEEINAVLGVTGQSIFAVKPQDMAVRMRIKYPDLASVEVKTYLPNHVYVTISERQPVILWLHDNSNAWIDSTGVAFSVRGSVEGLVPVIGLNTPPVLNIPPLEGELVPPPYIEKELVDAILVLAPAVPADSTMVFDSSNGLGWKDSRGWTVFFGTGTKNMDLKKQVYQSLADSLVERGTIPQFISVEYPEAPYYRMSYEPSSEGNGQ